LKKEEIPRRKNPNVYVTGLPLDVTIEEVKAYFEKCGIVREDFETFQPKIKLYRSDDGSLKGDALISYWKEESVHLASQILDQCTDVKRYNIDEI
jgi:HIV Tat-specific factor 1